MTEPKTGLASLELKDAVRLRWTLHDIKSRRTEIVPVSPDNLRVLIDMGLVEMRGDVPVVTPAGDAEINGSSPFLAIAACSALTARWPARRCKATCVAACRSYRCVGLETGPHGRLSRILDRCE